MISNDQKKWTTISGIVLIILALMAVLPFILLVIASFTDNYTAIKEGYSYFPSKLSLDAYKYIFQNASMIFRAYGITIITTCIGTFAGVLITSLYAYMISKKGLPGRKNLMVDLYQLILYIPICFTLKILY